MKKNKTVCIFEELHKLGDLKAIQTAVEPLNNGHLELSFTERYPSFQH
jgi:hypothetical protein